jgi:hypothetical protein
VVGGVRIEQAERRVGVVAAAAALNLNGYAGSRLVEGMVVYEAGIGAGLAAVAAVAAVERRRRKALNRSAEGNPMVPLAGDTVDL